VTNAAMIERSASTTDPWWAPVWARHASRYEAETATRAAGEATLRKELIFCLLGGHGVTYELAHSATKVVQSLRPFAPTWTLGPLRRAIHLELATPQFEPHRADGGLRRYRYPARKARLTAEAVAWVHAEGGLRRGLARRETEDARREWLCGCPGVGMKTASWLLRNSGWAQNLAILDVHLLRALAEAQVIEEPLLPRDYKTIERAYLSWANELGACPAALDLFLWDVQRARLATSS
jgi:N-glycosylase/DNA lyase